MIGPVSPGASFLTVADFGATAGTPGVMLMDTNGGTAIARVTASIYNLGSNIYGRLLTAPATEGWYLPVWDDSGGAKFADEAVQVATTSTGSSGSVSGDANGALSGLTFLIKRNDTLPYIRRQLVDSNGDPIDLSSSGAHGGLGTAGVVKFTMRPSSDTAMAGTAKVHASATVVDAATGIVEYRWAVADTDTTTDGTTPYAAEFEVTFNDGTIETFPQSSYIAVTIPRDLDPGVTP